MNTSFDILIGMGCTLVGGVVTYLSFLKTRDKEITDRVAREATRDAMIKNIDQTLTPMAVDLKSLNQTVNILSEKQTIAEIKITTLESKVEKLENKLERN